MNSADLSEARLRLAGHARRRNPAARWLLLYLAGAALLGLFQILREADPIVVLMAVSSVGLSAIPALLYGWRDLPSLVTLLIGFRYAASALIWKFFLWEPLEDGLYAAETSFTVVLVGSAAVVAAAISAHVAWPRAALWRERYTPSGVRLLLIVGSCFAAAAFAVFFFEVEVPGGIDALLWQGPALAFIAWVVLNYGLKRRSLTPALLFCAVAFSVATLGFGSRAAIGHVFIGIAAIIVSFHIRLRLRTMLAAGALLLFFALIVAPAITDVRDQRGHVGVLDLIGATIERIGDRIVGQATEIVGPGDKYYILRYTKVENTFVERAVNVQQLDFIVALAERLGPIGTDRFWTGIVELLPAFLASSKSVILETDYPFWVYGVRPWGFQTHIEVTAFGDAYVYGGYAFVALSMFAAYFLIYSVFRMFCPSLDGSVLAAFILAIYGHALTASTVLGILSIVLRELPITLLLFWLAIRWGRAMRARAGL